MRRKSRRTERSARKQQHHILFHLPCNYAEKFVQYFAVLITSRRLNVKKKLVVIHLHVRNVGRGTRWCSWLRHCAESRKVAGLNPDGQLKFSLT
jgi:hypothetical protein